MAWIFQECKDDYGACIRQYIVFGANLLIFMLCLYSIIMTIRKQKHYTFQLIPLVINGLSTLALLYPLSQFEQENLYLTMLVIEIYSYSLLTYSYVGLYLLGTKKISRKQFLKIKIGFIIFSFLILLGIITLIILQAFDKIQCKQSHGIGNLTLSLLQLPLYIIAFAFVFKTKAHIKSLENKAHQFDSGEINLLEGQDQYIKIRYQQANMMIISFSISIILHITTVVMFFSHKTSCQQDKYISTQNIYEVIMFSLFDFTTLLPHLSMPIILYFIPAYHNHTTFSSIHILPITTQKSMMNSDKVIFSEYRNEQKIRDMTRRNVYINGQSS